MTSYDDNGVGTGRQTLKVQPGTETTPLLTSIKGEYVTNPANPDTGFQKFCEQVTNIICSACCFVLTCTALGTAAGAGIGAAAGHAASKYIGIGSVAGVPVGAMAGRCCVYSVCNSAEVNESDWDY